MKLLFFSIPALVAAHGYLSSPPPRGIEKTAYAIDDLKSPNHKGLCRGEPPGKVTKVTSGGQLTLGLTITAPHTGPCEVSLLSYPDLTLEKKFASKYDCAAPGKAGPWTITLPQASGRKVLRWYWEGRHVSPGEPYEQCIDVDFGGGSGGGGDSDDASGAAPTPAVEPAPVTEPAPAPADRHTPKKSKKSKKSKKKSKKQRHDSAPEPANYDDSAPAPNYAPAPASAPSHDSGSCEHGKYACSGSGYKICNWGQWIEMACGAGTRCMPSGDSIVCG